ncbi:MAG: recombinase family protein, partial [Candidatus Levybacteria bacterium]|nr:recombinase family protein [Candidatus Levybacteria bacterium]
MKYIAYCRKSTDEKDRQILSIEAQIAELTEFAKREGLEIAEFITEAKTAKVPGRPQFDKLLMMLEKGQAQGIISWHPDRLARNSIDGGKIIYL